MLRFQMFLSLLTALLQPSGNTGKCLKCKKSKKLVKLVPAPGFRFKGPGWYETDFKVGAKKNIHGEEKKAKSKKDEN